MRKYTSSHSPTQRYFINRQVLPMNAPKFSFEEPSETYGLLLDRHGKQSQSIDTIHNQVQLPTINKSQQVDDIISDQVVLVGNGYKRTERRTMPPRLKISEKSSIPVLHKYPKKPSSKKFNGSYFEDEKFSQDLIFQEKYATLRTYYNVMTLANGLYIISDMPVYKAYIGKGNNGQLVKMILKNRWWWQINDADKENVNFLWQQLKNAKYIESMNSKEQKFTPICQTNVTPFSTIIPPYDNNLIQSIYRKRGRNSKLLSFSQQDKWEIFEVTPETKLHNHVSNNLHLGSKKNLFYNLKRYYDQNNLNVFDVVPRTYHVKNSNDLQDFLTKVHQDQSIWIVKPGECTNRGHGIQVCQGIDEVRRVVQFGREHKNGITKTYIVQAYLERPLLYNKRKFDIRCYALYTSINGYSKAYWYNEGYIRTSSREFTTKNFNKMIHLTNDAVQKQSDEYGKYEKGNKVSFEEFSKSIEVDFYDTIYPKMRQITIDQFKAVAGKINSDRKENCFELFGLDYMVDENYKVWLIETNTNPCLECTGPLLSRLIPQLLENVFKLVIDPLFPPPPFYSIKKMPYDSWENKFELIYYEQGPIEKNDQIPTDY